MITTPDLVPGAMVTPSIRLVRMLGRGGMGSVWIAEHLRLHTEVVVKFMAAEYALNSEAMQRFEREATLAAQAKSPHVVQVFDHGVSQFGLPYIAMELLEGEDLASRLGREKVIDPVRYANWLAQVCRGLSRAHAKGIVHRDIKPENIFLCENDGEVLVKVLDFGIAKAEANPSGFSGTRTGAFLGTAFYMSPEQTMGAKDLDSRTDLWALGVVSYYALTGVRPFDAEAIGPLVIAITSGAITPPSARNPALTPAIDAWMARALARAREERFESARQMAESFSQALGAGLSAHAAVAASSLPGTPVLSPSVGTGVAPAQTAPTGAPLSASTMAPSVRTGPGGELDTDPVGIPRTRTPLLALGGVALVMAVGVVVAVVKLRGDDTGVPAEASASTESSGAPATAMQPVPVELPAPPQVAVEPSDPRAPAAPSAAPAAPAARVTGKQDKPQIAAARAPAVVVAPAQPVAAPAVAVPAPKPVVAAPAAAVPAVKPVTAVAPKPTAAPKNPLKMQME